VAIAVQSRELEVVGATVSEVREDGMKYNLHEIEKTQREDGFWIWLCANEQKTEWVTYLSREADPDDTILGHYFTREDLTRKDYEQRQELDAYFEENSDYQRPPTEDLNLLDTDYAEIMANSPSPNLEMYLRQWGSDAKEAREQTQWLTVLSKQPQTREEEEQWLKTWEEVTGRTISTEEFLALAELLWGN
jgi:hypothetical protein